MLEVATLLFFPALMVFAAISDLLTMTISNRVSIALAVLFVGMAFACGLSPAEIAWHLACGALMLVLTFFIFARGWIGGGDSKLAAATAIWIGSSRRLRVFCRRSWCFADARHARASKIASASVFLGTSMGRPPA
jgi:Flp pilus assembly protein protease CpaA